MLSCKLTLKENWWCLFKTEDVKTQQYVLIKNVVVAMKFCPLLALYGFASHPRKPADLQNLAPGTHPPFITYNGEVRTDVNKIEEFLEDVLAPPK